MTEWRFALASVVGASHVRLGTDSQDRAACEVLIDVAGEQALIAVVADGAGSAVASSVGAQLTCDSWLQLGRLHVLNRTVADLDADAVCAWIEDLRARIGADAEFNGLVARDYACTLVACIATPSCSLFAQVGDGAAVVSHHANDYEVVFWPEQGEYANETSFVTEKDAAQALRFQVFTERSVEIALFSDGLQRLLLHYDTQTAFAPFFKKHFQALRSRTQTETSAALSDLLSSEAVTSRTDDDTTLILATTLAGDAGAAPVDAPVEKTRVTENDGPAASPQ